MDIQKEVTTNDVAVFYWLAILYNPSKFTGKYLGKWGVGGEGRCLQTIIVAFGSLGHPGFHPVKKWWIKKSPKQLPVSCFAAYLLF
ncbi:hypothetical protein FKM82_019924 [Ascaphus truei]